MLKMWQVPFLIWMSIIYNTPEILRAQGLCKVDELVGWLLEEE